METGDGNNFGYSYYMPSFKGLKLRSLFTFNCCDLFGAFDRYLGPAYHHDRCERSVQMKLYTMHKREFVVIFMGFFVALGLVVLIGLVGPPITYTYERQASTTLNLTSAEIATGPYGLKSPRFSTYHGQVWLISKIDVALHKDEAFEKSFTMSLDLFGISEGRVLKLFELPTKRSRRLNCPNTGDCDPITLLHLGFIDFPKYFIALQFDGLESVHEKYHITDIHFYFKTYNPNFTTLEMSFRFIYATVTFLVTCWFMYVLRRYAVSDWSIEQKWMSILLPLLFLYNNPAFPLMFLINSTFPGMMDAVFQVTFLSGLFFFWLAIYHGIRVERRFLTFYLPKIILVGSLVRGGLTIYWISAIILASWQKMNTTRDPTYSYMLDATNFNNLKNFFIVCGVTYLIYLVYLILKAYSDLRSMPYFDLRLKFLTGLMLIVLKVSMLVTYFRFGMDILEDHFVANLSTKYSSSAEFMCFYGLLNFYIFTMVFVYSPSSSSTLNNSSAAITKDNPSFSMVNDSDEEVIYGSDDENDTKVPLNNNSRTTPVMMTQHNDDSD